MWAYQEAIVTADRAVIYSDQDLSSPIGYVARGKKIAIGEIARNKGRAYPIIVSEKIAYIRALDVTIERENLDSANLSAERFRLQSDPDPNSKISLGYLSYSSTINWPFSNDQIKKNDALLWHGVSLRGDALVHKRIDLQVIINYLGTSKGKESFRATEVGLGAAFRIINHRRLLFRLEAQMLGIPFASYELAGKFRKLSYGFGFGGGGVLTYNLGRNWGLEAYGGYYYTKLSRFDVPAPYTDVDPSFYGLRAGGAFSFTF